MEIYRIKKLGSVENPYDPNSDYGESQEWHYGYFITLPTEGERFELEALTYFNPYKGISTSPVTKVIDDNTFHTMNSIYYWEVSPFNPLDM